jgi:hypothetical protein
MRRLFPLVLLIAPVFMACATPPKAYIPVDSPLKPWEAPEADAYASEAPAPEPAPAPAPAPTSTKPGAAKEKKAEKRP